VTILVVEDDPSILTLVDRLLTSRGHTVLAASDTVQASAALRDHRGAPDMLLTDLVLAGDSGLDYAKSMKAAFPMLRVVFMTGWVHRAPSAQRSGLGPILRKPFTAQELFKIVENP
jgi:two-component system, cell cycle sensor histidine kinase and response regulator CckA